MDVEKKLPLTTCKIKFDDILVRQIAEEKIYYVNRTKTGHESHTSITHA